MTSRLTRLPLALLLTLGLVLTGCPDRTAEEEEIEIESPLEDPVAPEELIGTWLLIEQTGMAPEALWTVTFTTDGNYIVQSETRALDWQHYYLAGENMIAVTDEIGGEATQFYDFEVVGDRLYLMIPGTDASATLERRDDLLELREDLRPPIDPDPHPDAVPQVEMPEQEGRN
jgi:hypothetical protein